MILGVDLSLTATGLAEWSPTSGLHLDTIKTGELRGQARVGAICGRIWDRVRHNPGGVVIFEGLAPTPRMGMDNVLAMAALRGVLDYSLWSWAAITMDVSPSSLKKYATGAGNASKEDVRVHVDRRYRHIAEPADNNQADALVLTAMALHHYGRPLVDDLPKTHTSALYGNPKNPLQWPVWSLDGDPTRVRALEPIQEEARA